MIVFRNELNAIVTMLSWLAPSENVDGTAIDYELSYHLYVNGVATRMITGTPNGDRLEKALADIVDIQAPGRYVLTLTAMPFNAPPEDWPLVESEPSNAIVVTAIEVRQPGKPMDFSVE